MKYLGRKVLACNKMQSIRFHFYKNHDICQLIHSVLIYLFFYFLNILFKCLPVLFLGDSVDSIPGQEMNGGPCKNE